MKIAVLAPIGWRTPPKHYGPRESFVSLLVEGLVRRGVEVTLFATADSTTSACLQAVCPHGYQEDRSLEPKVWECLHISELFEQGDDFDLIDNHFDFLPLTYSAMTSTPIVTTIHGFSSANILPVYRKYNGRVHYVSISEADRSPELSYETTIHHGVDLAQFTVNESQGQYLLFFGRIHPEKGAREAIEIARRFDMPLKLAGIIQDERYYRDEVEPLLNDHVEYLGTVGPDERNRLLGGAYALLHPIAFAEPFGISAVESMACGTPVVAFRRGSMPELIAHGRTGFLCETLEEAVEALHNTSRIDRGECRRWVEERFTADRMVNDYLRVYERVVSAHKREDRRPWGSYRVLADGDDHKVKTIRVNPRHRLSLQRHAQRSEHWYGVKGRGIVSRDGEELNLEPGKAVDIPQGAWHRVENCGSEELLFVEVQTGSYFGEDDIERREDDYGRT